jgi:ketosteroid isomerase-like protein
MSAHRPDELVDTVKAMYDAFNRREIEEALTYISPDMDLRPSGTAAFTGRSRYQGHEGVREYFADVARIWAQGLRVLPVDYRAVAGSVVVFGRVEASGVPGPIEAEVVWVWKLRDGLVSSGQVFSTRGAAIAAAQAPA